jgi:hypothetical protein
MSIMIKLPMDFKFKTVFEHHLFDFPWEFYQIFYRTIQVHVHKLGINISLMEHSEDYKCHFPEVFILIPEHVMDGFVYLKNSVLHLISHFIFSQNKIYSLKKWTVPLDRETI